MTHTRKLLAAAAIAAISSTDLASAQGPPINTDTPIMLGLQGRGTRTFVKVVRRSRLLKNGQEVDDPKDRRATVTVLPIAVPYNVLSDKLQIGLVAPFMNVDLSTTESEVSNGGIGDVQLFTKYLLYQRDRRNQTIRVAAKAGVKLPTGDEKGHPPLGTGSTDYFFTTVGGWIKGRVGFYGEGIYHFNTSNEDVDFGDSASVNVAFGYRLLPVKYETYPSPQWNAYLELNGTTARRSSRSGSLVEDSGGTLVFLSPGIQYVGGRRWLIEGSFQFPIVNDPNGTQLATSWTASFGLRVLLF
jgi:hypothetical protein